VSDTLTRPQSDRPARPAKRRRVLPPRVRNTLARTAHVGVVLAIVTFATTLMLDLAPGDPARVAAGDTATEEQLAVAREQLHLDQPVVVRWLIWVGDLLRGDLGTSLRTRQEVWDVLIERFAVSAQIAVMSLSVALLIAIPVGTYCAYRANGRIDRLVQAVGSVLISAPGFLVALLLSYVFALQLGWFRIAGWTSFTEDPLGNLRSAALAVLALGLCEAAVFVRLLRSDMITVLGQEYILAATAKGLRPYPILIKHALRPSSFSLITLSGISLGRLIGGTVTIEVIFAIPGIGQLLYQSIVNKDVVMVQGAVAFVAIAYILINALVDLMYARLDPRIKVGGRKR
jgi:peptide/nickel transport system permease protein